MAQSHRTVPGRVWHGAYIGFCVLVFIFLIAPLIVVVPLSFNAQPFFTFTEGMLRFDPAAYSLQWYRDIVGNNQWLLAIRNSIVIAICATTIAATLGTLAAVGLSRPNMPWRGAVMTILISPMIIPIIIV